MLETKWQYNAAEPFKPHGFQTKLAHQFIEPKVCITPNAYADMLVIAENSGSDEVGWLGTVNKLNNGRYLIEEIFLPAQQVCGATCELSEDGIGELFTELAQTNFDACEHMHFWGHVHPGNCTSPSGQDDQQMGLFAHNDFFIRGIFGRNGRAEFTFCDYTKGILWTDVQWSIYCPIDENRRAKWAKEVKQKVKKMVIETAYRPFQGGPSRPISAGKGSTKKRR
jgi:hypothetical protein